MLLLNLISVLSSREWEQKGENLLQWLWTRSSHLRRRIFLFLRKPRLGPGWRSLWEESRTVTNTGLVGFGYTHGFLSCSVEVTKDFPAQEEHRETSGGTFSFPLPLVWVVSPFVPGFTSSSFPHLALRSSQVFPFIFSDSWMKTQPLRYIQEKSVFSCKPFAGVTSNWMEPVECCFIID